MKKNRSKKSRDTVPLRLSDRVEGSPSCEEGGGRVFVGCYDSRLYCLDMRTGQIIWYFQAQVGFTVPYLLWQHSNIIT
jgi:outer membrane protein assembly factor BamB